uniref:Uncharacterized protein n=1 Tax=Rhizophora mucronata TaxID=61149 RepID=A0A2P2MP88_RHIMU
MNGDQQKLAHFQPTHLTLSPVSVSSLHIFIIPCPSSPPLLHGFTLLVTSRQSPHLFFCFLRGSN